jgi:hypothetical protein
MKPASRLLAVLLLSTQASAGGFEDAGFARAAAFRPDMSALRAAYQASQAAVAADRQVTVPLPELLNNMRRTPNKFKAGAADVSVFGVRAQNNPGLAGWYIGFSVNGGEAQYYKASDALKIKVMGLGPNRHLEIWLNGLAFDLQIDVVKTDTMKTRVVITQKVRDARPTVFTVEQLAEGVYQAGWPLTIGGREYRLLYTENIEEVPPVPDRSGKVAKVPLGGNVRVSGERVIAIMFRDAKNGIAGYGWMERYIPKDQPMTTWTIAKGADADGEPGPAMSVMIDAMGHLDLQYKAPAPSKKR